MGKKVTRRCKNCGDDFHPTAQQVSLGHGRYCSRTCHAKSHGRIPTDNGDGTFTIPLTRGKSAIVDATDIEVVSPYSWSLEGGRGRYAVARVSARPMKMHRLILGLNTGQMCDHINGNGLDNRRSNLRVATRDQNAKNVRVREGKKFKGVQELPSGRFRARIAEQHLGTFDTEKEAAIAYNHAASRLFGEFARLNIIPEGTHRCQ